MVRACLRRQFGLTHDSAWHFLESYFHAYGARRSSELAHHLFALRSERAAAGARDPDLSQKLARRALNVTLKQLTAEVDELVREGP